MWFLTRNFLLTIAWYLLCESVLGDQKETFNQSSAQKWIQFEPSSLISNDKNTISTSPKYTNQMITKDISSSNGKSQLLSRHKRQFFGGFGGGGCCSPFQMNPICCPIPLPVPMPIPMPLPVPMPIPIPQPIGGGCCSCCMPMCSPVCLPRCGLGMGLGGLGGLGFGGLGMGGGMFGGCGSPFGFRKHRKTKF